MMSEATALTPIKACSSLLFLYAIFIPCCSHAVARYRQRPFLHPRAVDFQENRGKVPVLPSVEGRASDEARRLVPHFRNRTTIDCFASLALTYNDPSCHCEERSDEE